MMRVASVVAFASTLAQFDMTHVEALKLKMVVSDPAFDLIAAVQEQGEGTSASGASKHEMNMETMDAPLKMEVHELPEFSEMSKKESTEGGNDPASDAPSARTSAEGDESLKVGAVGGSPSREKDSAKNKKETLSLKDTDRAKEIVRQTQRRWTNMTTAERGLLRNAILILLVLVVACVVLVHVVGPWYQSSEGAQHTAGALGEAVLNNFHTSRSEIAPDGQLKYFNVTV